MTPRPSYDVLLRLAEALDKWAKRMGAFTGTEDGRITDEEAEWVAIRDRLSAYRAEIAPKLRSRAEVDAERLLNLDAFMSDVIGSAELRARDCKLQHEPTAEPVHSTPAGSYDWSRVPQELWAALAHECCCDDHWHNMRVELLAAIQAVQRAAKEPKE